MTIQLQNMCIFRVSPFFKATGQQLNCDNENIVLILLGCVECQEDCLHLQ